MSQGWYNKLDNQELCQEIEICRWEHPNLGMYAILLAYIRLGFIIYKTNKDKSYVIKKPSRRDGLVYPARDLKELLERMLSMQGYTKKELL